MPSGTGVWSSGGASQSASNCGRGNGCCAVDEARVRQHDDHGVERLGDLARRDHRVEAVLDARHRHHDLGRVAVAAVDRREQVALLDLGRLAGGRPAALDVDDHQRNLGHHREPDAFLLQRIARPRGDRDGALAGVGGADRERAGGDLVLRLVHDAADALEHVGQVVRHRRRGRDRVHRADVHAGGEHAQRQRGVAVDDDLRLGRPHGRNPVLEVEVLLRPRVARVEQPLIDLDDLRVLLAEREGDLLATELGIQAVQVAQHPEHEHVLALARVGDELVALALERDLVDAEAGLLQHVDRFDIRGDDLRIAMLAPHALEQDLRAGLQLAGAHAAEQHLLVERDDEIGLVAAVGHLLRADADADARGARDAARRRLDLGRDDLRGPDAVAAPRRDAAERLAAALRALARVADDLDDVLGQRLRRARLAGRGRRAGGACRSRCDFGHGGESLTRCGWWVRRARGRSRARRARIRSAGIRAAPRTHR